MDLCDIAAAVKKIDCLGDIHLLVNNAGIAILGPFEDSKPDDFDTYVFMLIILLSYNYMRNSVVGAFDLLLQFCHVKIIYI